MNRNHRQLVAFTTACLASVYGCSSAPPDPVHESLGSTHGALTGSVTFDTSCMVPPTPQTTPPAVPENVMRHLQISEAYARIAANSPAFRECMQNVMTRPTTLGVPGRTTWVSGPYLACHGDPAPATLTGVLRHALATTGTRISCDYSAIGTSRGGEASVGNIVGGEEIVAFGNELGSLNPPENCAYNPDGSPCVGDGVYDDSAQTIAHEVMHAQGYFHVRDSVWNLNNVNVGDVVGTGPTAYALTLDDFCGIAPAPTPGTGGVAPTDPSASPTPGPHPTYGSSIPYEVGQCVQTVLDWSEASGRLHADCGPRFAGLNLVDSVMSGDPASTASHCVADPYVGVSYPSNVGGAPIPPHAPTECTVGVQCRTTDPVTVSCTDDNANFLHVERRAVASSGPWQRVTSYTAGFDYRVCSQSLYGRACSTPSIQLPALCAPVEDHASLPIPWWEWEPFTGIVADDSAVLGLLGGSIVAVPVPVGEASKYPWLGNASGDLSPAFGALGVGVYNPQIGRFEALGPSTGAMPPMRGTAFAMAVGNDGQPHLIGIGGESAKGVPIGNLYDGTLTLGKATGTSWVSAPMFDARTHASAASDALGKTVFVLGGRTTKGALGDLWSYGVASGKWTSIDAQATSPRSDAAMAVEGTSLVIFGGRDASGKALGDLVVRDLATGKTQSFATSLVPRANAAIAVRQDRVFVYGGQTDGAASEALDVVSLGSGKTISSSKVGIAATSGSAIGVDASGVVTLIPGAVPGAQGKAGAFVGLPGQLTFVAD